MNVKTAAAAILVCGAAALSGCASMHSKGDSSALAPASENYSHDVVDSAYVAKVDRRASEMGVQVIWINLPDKANHN